MPKPEGLVCKREDLIVSPCDNHDANALVEQEHYLHRKIYIGRNLSYKITHLQYPTLWGVVMFGYPVFNRKKKLVGKTGPLHNGELVELCRVYLPNEFPTNTESCAIGACIRYLKRDWKILTGFKPKAVISFADTEFTHQGTIYMASNFQYLGWVRGRKATPGLGQGRWGGAIKAGAGQKAGERKNVYLLDFSGGQINVEELRGTYSQ